MTRVQEIREQAGALSDRGKTALAVDLLESLPPALDDENGGLAEALRRDQDLDRDPSQAITWDQLRCGLGR